MKGIVDFGNQKVVPIDMTDLDVSIKEKWLDGTPVGGITHFDLMKFVLDTFSTVCDPHVKSMYAVNNRDKVRPGVTQDAALAEQIGLNDAQTMIFRRVHALFYLKRHEEISTAVAVSWHQLGFTLGIGPNVRVCENGCILDAKHVVSSYTLPYKTLKERKLPLDMIKDTVEGWAKEFNGIDDGGQQFMEKLKGVELEPKDMIFLFGKLAFDRVQSDLGTTVLENPPFAALNQSQLNIAMSQYGIEYFGRHREENKPLLAWDAMNYFNFPLKPLNCDVPLILPQQYAVTKVMLDYLESK
jgi:hypothetical protein